MSYTVVSFGEVLWDLLPKGAVLGGAPFNLAFRVNSLGNKGIILSKLGKDNYGDKALLQIKQFKMNTDFIQIDNNYPTGTVNIFFDENKEPDYDIITNVAYDFINPEDSLFNLLEKADCFCFGLLAQRNPVSKDTIDKMLNEFKGPYIFLDINLRKNCYTKENIISSLKKANIIKFNEEEVKIIAKYFDKTDLSIPDFIDFVIETNNLKYCILTLGDKGAYTVSDTRERVYLPAYSIKLEDPCGSGDAFSAGFIHSILNGKSLFESCRLGNALGSIVANQKGATQLITISEIENFIKTREFAKMDPVFKKYFKAKE